MQSPRFNLTVIRRMAGWCLAFDAVLGLLYGLISSLILQAVYIADRLNEGGPYNGSVAEVLYSTDTGAFLSILVLSILFGAIAGAVVGFLGGVISGVVMVVVFRFNAMHVSDVRSHRSMIGATSGFITGLIALILLTMLNIPSGLSYLGQGWVVLGWVVETAIPVLIVFGAAWLVSNRVITTWGSPSPALFHIREYDE